MRAKSIELYRKCCLTLGVDEFADQSVVRKAYIELVKKIHPDSASPEASAERFSEVDNAFKILQEKFAKNRRGIFEEDEEEAQDIRHTVPQHRHYLSFDGVGSGNPFQREKQYQHIKSIKAQERVLKHRIDKSQAGEKTLLKKGQFYTNHAIKTKYGLDRIVEDYIQEAMSKGDFDNLNGTGKPLTLSQEQNPYLDFTTHKLNKILMDNGFTPEWITLQRDIRVSLQELKKNIVSERVYFGDYPLNEDDLKKWRKILKTYEYEVQQINKNIDKYNLIVPIMQNQYFRINLESFSEGILKDPDLPKNKKRPHTIYNSPSSPSPYDKSDLLSFLGYFFKILKFN